MKWLQRMQELTLTPLGWFSLGILILTVLIDTAMLYFYCSIFLVSQLVFFVFFVDPFDSCFRFWFRLFFYEKQPLKEAPLLCLRPKISKLQRSFSRSFDNLSGRLRLSIENLGGFVGGEELKVFSGSPKSATPRTRRPSAERQRLQRTFMRKTEKDNIRGILERLVSVLGPETFCVENCVDNGNSFEKIINDIQSDRNGFYLEYQDVFLRIKNLLVSRKTVCAKALAHDLDQLFDQVPGYDCIAPVIVENSAFDRHTSTSDEGLTF